MAYVDQARKKALQPQIKEVLKKWNVKATIAVKHYSTLVVNLKSGPVDFWSDAVKPFSRDYFQVNEYHYKNHYTGKSLDFLSELIPAMNGVGTDDPNFDRSDVQSDYFFVGWYIDVNVGDYQKPYQVIQ